MLIFISYFFFLFSTSTLVSPSDGILRTPSQNSYTLLEATPYYIGEAFSMNLSYPKNWYQVEYGIKNSNLINSFHFFLIINPTSFK